MYYPYTNTYLMHYGIVGMKWGVRRYQNEDGSLKPGGEGHYYSKKNHSKNLYSGPTKSRKQKTAQRNVQKSRNEMSKSDKAKKAAKIVGKEVVLPEVKKAAKMAAIAGLTTAGLYTAMRYKDSPAAKAMIAKFGKQRFDQIVKSVNGVGNLYRAVNAMPVTKVAKKAGGAAIGGAYAYKTAKKVDKELHEGGVTDREYLKTKTKKKRG